MKSVKALPSSDVSLSGPVGLSAEREVQAEAAAAGGFQQRGRGGEMFQKGLHPSA